MILRSFHIFITMKNILLICLLTLSNISFAQSNDKETRAYIIEQSVEGGELDFSTKLTEQQFYLFDAVAYNKKDFAIFLWAQKVKILGIESVKEAIAIREEIKGEKLSQPEKTAVTNGYNFVPDDELVY